MQKSKKIGLLSILVLLPMLVFAKTVKLTEIDVSKGDQSARIAFSLSEPVSYKIFTLDHPHRLVIDFPKTHLTTGLQKNKLPNIIKSIRSGHPDASTLRLVFDLSSSVDFKAFTQTPKIYLDIYAPDAVKPAVKQSVFTAPAVTDPTPIMSVQAKNETTKPLVIIIDPGHGGKDPGAIGGNGAQEKTVVLGVARRLAELINQTPNMRAVLTRHGDYFVPLRERLKLARKGKGDLFMSIHADSYFNNTATGASVYALSRRGASSEAARWIARRENYSELGGVDLGELGDQSYLLRSVLIDLAQTATITDSLRLGTSLLDSLESMTRLHYSRVEQAPFVVLKSPDIPSVLVETGFISNPTDEYRLSNRDYQERLAQALYHGVRRYLKNYPATSV